MRGDFSFTQKKIIPIDLNKHNGIFIKNKTYFAHDYGGTGCFYLNEVFRFYLVSWSGWKVSIYKKEHVELVCRFEMGIHLRRMR